MNMPAVDQVPTAADPPRVIGTRHSWWRHGTALVGGLRRCPATLGLIALIWVLGATSASLLRGPTPRLRQAIGVGPATLMAGHWWSPVTSLLWCANLGGYLLGTALLLAVLAPAERRLGSLRAALLLLITQIVGTVAGSALVLVTTAAGASWTGRLAGMTAIGVWPAAVGVGLALSAWLTATWRRRVRLLLTILTALLVAYRGNLVDIFTAVAGFTGLITGWWMTGRPRRHHRPYRVADDRRVLVALAVAATALGPIAVALSTNAVGPLSALRYLFLAPAPDPATVQQICADPATLDDCRAARALLQLSGVGPAITTLMPVLLLLVAADGLRLGRRAAWLAAMTVNLALAAVAVVMVLETAESTAGSGPVVGPGSGALDVVPFTVPLLMVIVLLMTRRAFPVRAPAGTYRRAGLVCGAAVLLLGAAYVGLGFVLRDHFDHPPSVGELLANLPTRFVPPAYLADIDPAFLPVGTAATVLFEWTGPLLLSVVCVALLVSFRRNQGYVPVGDRTRAREMLLRYGGSSLAHMILWRGNSYHFGPGERTVTGYRIVGTVAVGLFGPVGPVEQRGPAITDFARYCAGRGLTPCWYSVTSPVRDAVAQELHWQSVQVAAEAVIDLAEFSVRGKKWQSVRTATNKAEQLGITAQWIDYRATPARITQQIRAISRQWVADKGLPEMGFTLGGVRELLDPDVRCLIAVDQDGSVHAVLSFLPAYRDGKPIAWTLDFMRRRANGFPGAVEFLIAHAAIQLRDEGAEYLSLSGAPLARIADTPPPDWVQRLLDATGQALEPVYGFQSLLEFKAKFQPTYQPLWLLYPETATLPIITNAIVKSYVPTLTAGQGSRLFQRLYRAHRGRISRAFPSQKLSHHRGKVETEKRE